MKLKSLAALALSAVLLLSGCAAPAQNETTPESSSTASETTAVSERVITDSYGAKTKLPDDPCVVSLYGSFAECWLLSGGKLAGITEDAVDEHGIEIDDDTALVGTVTEPNLGARSRHSPGLRDFIRRPARPRGQCRPHRYADSPRLFSHG